MLSKAFEDNINFKRADKKINAERCKTTFLKNW